MDLQGQSNAQNILQDAQYQASPLNLTMADATRILSNPAELQTLASARGVTPGLVALELCDIIQPGEKAFHQLPPSAIKALMDTEPARAAAMVRQDNGFGKKWGFK